MKRIRILQNLLLGETLFVLLLLGMLRHVGYIWPVLSVGLLVQAGFVFYMMKTVILPLKNFAETMDELTRTDCQEEKLEKISGDIPYMEQIRELTDRYATQRTRKNSAEILDKQTELTALQSQINPHFLYNTLESIRGQALLDDNLEIARMVEALAAFFRYSISRKGNLVTLRDELANIDNYMMIQRYRFNNRFSM